MNRVLAATPLAPISFTGRNFLFFSFLFFFALDAAARAATRHARFKAVRRDDPTRGGGDPRLRTFFFDPRGRRCGSFVPFHAER